MKVLLAIDYSTFSQEAVRSVITQMKTNGAQVRILHVLTPAPALPSTRITPAVVPYFQEEEADRRKQAARLVLGAAQRLRNAGFKTKGILDTGDPRERIIIHADQWPADLIIVGSHGWKGLGRFLMGSVSDSVTRHARCSVQVVRRRSATRGTKALKSKRTT